LAASKLESIRRFSPDRSPPIKGFEAIGFYNASKAAIRSFARSLIVDLKGRNILNNVLIPGHIDTPGLSGHLQ
jgi:NAD(P)-dependent dehydrogenase (short-subunit alcohol dehydrogenase family)